MATLSVEIDDETMSELHALASRRGLPVETVVKDGIMGLLTKVQDTDDFDVRQMYPHMAKVFGPAGWDDREMDEYDNLDPRRQS